MRRRRTMFHLKTHEEPTGLTASRMSEVDFISYRPELTGSVDCSPLKEPMAVYVTWRQASDASGARVVVAIEFLPKDPGLFPEPSESQLAERLQHFRKLGRDVAAIHTPERFGADAFGVRVRPADTLVSRLARALVGQASLRSNDPHA